MAATSSTRREAVAAGPNITSTWFAANADGSGAVAILPKLTSESGARMAISPDATQVAVTNANPTPNVASGPDQRRVNGLLRHALWL